MGYVLRPGFLLPPLMFSQQEIEALVLGSRWVAGRADAGLAEAARAALVKIGAVLPDALREELDNSTLLVGPGQGLAAIHVDLAAIRDTIRKESKVVITYRDEKGDVTERVIWPFALAFSIWCGWCWAGARRGRTTAVSGPTASKISVPWTAVMRAAARPC